MTSSNLEKMIEKGLKIAENMSRLWSSSDFDDKKKLQYLIFPDGILYNKQIDRVQTPKINSLFAAIQTLSTFLGKTRTDRLFKNGQDSHLVGVR